MKERIDPEGKPSTDSNVTIPRTEPTQNPLRSPTSISLWSGINQEQCHDFFRDHYCKRGVQTFDGIDVAFASPAFKHAFFESPCKAEFAQARAERIRWIESLLHDPSALLLVGFNKKTGTYDYRRRVALWPDEAYLTVIQFDDECGGFSHFITAFVLSDATKDRVLRKLLLSPRWPA